MYFFSKKVQETASISQTVSEVDNRILVIFQDSQNNYWFGEGEQGVYKYDGKNLVLYTVKDGLCSSAILGIQEDKFGNIYFDTSAGVSKFDGQKFTTLAVIDNILTKNAWKLEPNDLWFRMGWNKNRPYRYDGEFLYYLEFPKTDLVDTFYSKYPNSSYSPMFYFSLFTKTTKVFFGLERIMLEFINSMVEHLKNLDHEIHYSLNNRTYSFMFT